MTNTEIHKILDSCLDEAKEKKLYGQISFTLHCQAGDVRQVSDKENDGIRSKTRTWKSTGD